MKSKILTIATWLTKIGSALTVFAGVVIVLLMILWQFDIELLSNFRIVEDGSTFKFETSPSREGIPLKNYDNFYFYIILTRSLVLISILYLILRQVLKVVTSIRTLETFKTENSQAFQQMGKLFIAWLIISIIGIQESGDGLQISATLNFKYGIYAITCFVLAEIFSEGNKLMEENKLTV